MLNAFINYGKNGFSTIVHINQIAYKHIYILYPCVTWVSPYLKSLKTAELSCAFVYALYF